MLQNYLKIALRPLRAQQWYTLLSILGLTVGLAVGIAVLTVSFQSIRAALVNNAYSLIRKRLPSVRPPGPLSKKRIETQAARYF